MNYIIVTNRKWYYDLPDKLKKIYKEDYFLLISRNNDLSMETIKRINPKYIFFPHWSYKIPEEIYDNFECIIFHMTDLPFGRGGSPLQNLVSRGIYETKISALRCVEELDAGPVYMKVPFALYGNAEEIYIRAEKIIEKMIKFIIENQPVPIEQEGEVVYFKRRTPEQGNVESLTTLEEIFDYIRMLDAEGYPNAFLETPSFKFEFQRAVLKKDFILADVKIIKREV